MTPGHSVNNVIKSLFKDHSKIVIKCKCIFVVKVFIIQVRIKIFHFSEYVSQSTALKFSHSVGFKYNIIFMVIFSRLMANFSTVKTNVSLPNALKFVWFIVIFIRSWPQVTNHKLFLANCFEILTQRCIRIVFL